MMLNLLCYYYFKQLGKNEARHGKGYEIKKVEKVGKIGLETLFWFGLRKAKA